MTMITISNEYEKLLNQSLDKYGDLGIGTLIVRLSYLSHLVKHDYLNNDEKVIGLLNKIVLQYNFERIPPSTLKDYIFETIDETTQEITYGFDEGYFNKKYLPAFPQAEEKIHTINNRSEISLLKDSQWYLFVISDEDDLIIYDSPMNVTELVLNRNEIKINDVPLVHPILVKHKNLRVKTAGELSIIFNENNDLNGVIVNSKSGHFRPRQSSIKHATKVISEKLALNENKVFEIPIGLK